MCIKNPISDLTYYSYLSVKVTLNRYVFRTDLRFSRDDAFLISGGNLFHKVRVATLNAQSLNDLSQDTGTCSSI